MRVLAMRSNKLDAQFFVVKRGLGRLRCAGKRQAFVRRQISLELYLRTTGVATLLRLHARLNDFAVS